jgi:plasmid stabilization system protein ParE
MKVVVKEEVYSDLLQIVKWYEAKSPEIALAFLDEWEQSLTFVSENPFAFQIKFKNFRHSKVTRFPYLIIFEIENAEIIIYSVIHCSRKPTKRYKRR